MGKISPKDNPYQTSLIGDTTTITVGVKSGSTINVAVQFKDWNAGSLGVRAHLRAYLSTNAHGDNLAASAPTGGVSIGSNGVLLPRTYNPSEALLKKGTLVIDATPEKFKTTTTAVYMIGGVVYSKAAATALVFSAAHVISASKFGVILVQVNAAGTISTKVPLATQAYTSAPLALAALPAPDAGNVALGYIAIATGVAAWTGNTDDLTNGSDVTTAAFNDATELTVAPRAFDLVSNASGQVDINITDSGSPAYYLVLQLPDGSLKASSIIQF
jgi:hypothetical protein